MEVLVHGEMSENEKQNYIITPKKNIPTVKLLSWKSKPTAILWILLITLRKIPFLFSGFAALPVIWWGICPTGIMRNGPRKPTA